MAIHLSVNKDKFKKGFHDYYDLTKIFGFTCKFITPELHNGECFFWYCENIPDNLPPIFYDWDFEPFKQGANGMNITDELANEIRDYGKR